MHFHNARLILPDGIERGSASVREGRISQIKRGLEAPRGSSLGSSLDLRGGYLAPGFIDLHIHGGIGRDTMEATAEAFRTITEFHLRGGTTSIALTTVTAAEEEILRVLEAVKPLKDQSLGGSRIIGVHVEGPFISKEKPGAQNPTQIRAPRKSEWRKYLHYGGLIAEMTLAPEIAGSLPLIRALKKNGTIVSGGHTNAMNPICARPLQRA